MFQHLAGPEKHIVIMSLFGDVTIIREWKEISRCFAKAVLHMWCWSNDLVLGLGDLNTAKAVPLFITV